MASIKTKQFPHLILAAALAAVACVMVLACSLAPGQAFANREFTAPTMPDGSTMTVSDDITRIHVDKVEYGTHEFVTGAKMQIIVQETGEVVDEWTTDGTTHKFEKGLDVNVRYVLREVQAPEGYTTVGDTVFIVNETEGTGITIVTKDPDTELNDYYKVTLYDRREDVVNEVEKTEDREIPVYVPVYREPEPEPDTPDKPTPTPDTPDKPDTPKASTQPMTGDWTMGLIVGVVAVAAIAFIIAIIARRRMNKS